MEFKDYVDRQKEWSLRTFGEGKRTEGIVQHIKHEIDEIQSARNDVDKLEECIDIIILTMDMAWRLGFSPMAIEHTLEAKQYKNFTRQWPPKEVSEANQDKPTFHIKNILKDGKGFE